MAVAGADEARENRVSGRTTTHVNDSPREITALATTFIDDFLHSERTPEFCVRNFSDSCAGKQDELRDIRDNRARFANNPAASSMGTGSIAFYDSGDIIRRRPAAPSQAGLRRVPGAVPLRVDREGHRRIGNRRRHLPADAGLRELAVAPVRQPVPAVRAGLHLNV